MNNIENQLANDLDRQLNPATFKPTPMKEVLRAAEAPKPAPRQDIITKSAVLTRMADAMHRIERVAEHMEQVAAEAERQLGIVKQRL